jgi:hypothetical protein
MGIMAPHSDSENEEDAQAACNGADLSNLGPPAPSRAAGPDCDVCQPFSSEGKLAYACSEKKTLVYIITGTSSYLVEYLWSSHYVEECL